MPSDAINELRELLGRARRMGERGEEPSVEGPVARLEEAAAEIARAWSGSSYGFHARVHYADLEPPPPGAHFSSEWDFRTNSKGRRAIGDSTHMTTLWLSSGRRRAIQTWTKRAPSRRRRAQLVVVSQTCDVIEHPRSSPYITLAPVVQIADEGRAGEAGRGYMPRYAPVPGAGANAFADLAFHVTIEKPVLRDAAKTTGLTNDDEIRLFQDVTQRHASRFAFPNEMALAFEPLRRRLREKKDKDSFEGKALRLIEEIRLLATPDWAADVLDVDVFFLLKSREAVEALEADPRVWEKQRAAWEARCGTNDKISKLRLILVPFEELEANTYRASDKLDLGGMSPQ